MLQFDVYQDTYFVRAFGFMYSDFMNAQTQRMNNHVEYGIKPYMDERTKYAREQMPELVTSVNEPTKENHIYPNPSSSPVVYYYSGTSDPSSVMVYSSTGQPVVAEVLVKNENTVEIRLPMSVPAGLYLIRSREQVMKWVYR